MAAGRPATVEAGPLGRTRPPARAGMELAAAAVAVMTLAALLVSGVVALTGAQAFWLCVPVAVAGATLCRTRIAAALVGLFAVLAAAAPVLVAQRLGELPPTILAVAVPALSAAVARFVRERLEAGRDALAELARQDPLTGLPNRRALDDRLAYEVVRHGRHGRRFALLMLDLNDFKAINERFGHSGGDEVLRDVGRALRRAVREQDTVGRLSGDEFCAPETDRDDAARLEERLRPAIERATGGFEHLSGSVGCAAFPDDGRSAGEILAVADAAQAEDKRRRRERERGAPARAAA